MLCTSRVRQRLDGLSCAANIRPFDRQSPHFGQSQAPVVPAKFASHGFFMFVSKNATMLAFIFVWNDFRSNCAGSEHMPGGFRMPQGTRNEKWPAPGTERNSTLEPSASRTSLAFVAYGTFSSLSPLQSRIGTRTLASPFGPIVNPRPGAARTAALILGSGKKASPIVGVSVFSKGDLASRSTSQTNSGDSAQCFATMRRSG